MRNTVLAMIDPTHVSARLKRLIQNPRKWPLSPVATVILSFGMISLALRLYNLGAKPVHYDEGVHAYWSWNLLHHGEYVYEGKYHGPLLYYLSSISFKIFEPSVTVGRGAVAVASLVIFVGLYSLRSELSVPTITFSGAIIAFHPVSLWPARFYRNDALTVGLLIAVIGLLLMYKKRSSRRHAIALGGTSALFLGTKELAFIQMGILIATVLLLAHFSARYDQRSVRQAMERFAPAGNLHWAVITTGFGTLLLYSGVPPNFVSAPTILIDGLLVWVGRAGGTVEPLYYIRLFLRQAPIILGLAGLGCLTTVLRPESSWVRWLVIGQLTATSVILSFNSHQWQWLAVHIFVLMTITGGFALSDIGYVIQSRTTLIENPARLLRVLPTVLLIAALISPAYMGGGTEPRIAGLNDDSLVDYRQQAASFALERRDENNCHIYVGPSPDFKWPYQWFFRSANWTLINNQFADTREPFNRSTMWPAVVVNEQELSRPLPESRVRTFGPYHVYYPKTNCG